MSVSLGLVLVCAFVSVAISSEKLVVALKGAAVLVVEEFNRIWCLESKAKENCRIRVRLSSRPHRR